MPSHAENGASLPPEARSSDADFWAPDGKCGQLLQDQWLIVPVVGAGLSQAAGLPGSSELCTVLVDAFRSDVGSFSDETDVRTVADEIVGRDPGRSQMLRGRVAEYWRQVVGETEPAEIVRQLIRVPSRMILTLNYDCLLEKAAEDEGCAYESLAGLYGMTPFESLARSSDLPEKLTILHLHGSAREPHTIVLDSTAYREANHARLVPTLFEALMANRRLCFLGTRLDESYLIADYQSAIKSDQPHPMFVNEATADQIRTRAKLTEVTHGIKVCLLPSQDHLRGLVRHLARRPVEPSEIPATPAAAAEPITVFPDYVRTVLTLCSEVDAATTDLYAQLSLGRRPDPAWGAGSITFLTEEELVTGNRNLVLGAPGSGKSELLRFAGQAVPAKQQPVLIRLTDVPLDPAEPAVRLARWADRGRGLRGDVSVAREALESETFHFLLDGLNEVAPPLQERLARQINGIADGFPQHSFTVASRPVEAAALLRSGWRCVLLQPGTVWQRRYLEHRGIELEDVVDQLENGRDLLDVLKLPFFLTRVVELHDRGLLAGLGLWGVARKLVDLALEAEEARELLPVSPSEARDWLRKAALAMQLAGRVVLPFEAVDDVPLRSGVTTERSEICEALVQRAMLHRQSEGYAFVHRILGEALAAEALEEREPSAELLASIAPQRSEAIQGVRADWRVTMTFLLGASPRWRDAIKPRDPLQWARSVPCDAADADRSEAAPLLWDTYVDWDIWIWDYQLPDVIQDGRALARLIGCGGRDELVAAIRAGIDGPTGRIQGNAIKVLSLAQDGELEPDLRRVLEDDQREAVVRRKAAIAAADLGLHDLLPLIIQRAVEPAEEVETQDCVIAAMKLATDQELCDVVRALLPNADARTLALSRVEQSLGPREIVALMADWAKVDRDPYSSEKDTFLDAVSKLEIRDSETIRDAAEVAVVWEVDSDELGQLLDRDHEAALAGIAAGIDDSRGGWWAAFALLRRFSPEELEAAGAPEIVVARRRSLDDPAYQAKVEASIAEAQRASVEGEPERPPTLRELLAQPPEDAAWVIQHNAHHFSREVDDLTESEREDLRQRLREWQEDKPFYEAITWKRRGGDGNSWSIEHWANALLWLGPAVGLELDPERWAEIAVSEVIVETHYEWLRRTATDASMRRAAELCTSPEARVWNEVLLASPDPLPAGFIPMMLKRLEQPDADGYWLRSIAERLVKLGELDALRELAAKSASLEAPLRPFLARVGDDPAIQAMFEELAKALKAGERPDHDELGWLDGALETRYLPQLFECLALVQTTPAREAGFVTTASPLIEAIRIIGGDEAVAGYDEMLATGTIEFRFLRLQRQAVAEGELAKDGVAAAPAAAKGAGVPALK